MTVVALHTLWPIPNDASPSSGQAMLINASGERVGMIFEAPATGTITKVGVKLGTVTTGDDLKISIQGVDATNGNPDGTINGSASVETVLATADNTWLETATTDLSASVTRGSTFSIVVEFNSFVAGDLEIDRWGATPNHLFPYLRHDTGAGYASPGNFWPLFSLNYGGTFHEMHGVYPLLLNDWGGSQWDNNDNPDERGLKFKSPVEVTLSGVSFVLRASAAGAPIDIKLYDAVDTLLETVTLDEDFLSAGNVAHERVVQFVSDHTLTADAFYRISVEPQSTTSTIRTGFFTTNSSAEMTQMPGGTDIIWTERNDGGAWTDVDSKRAYIWPIITEITAGAGGGGLKMAGSSGGMVG